MKGYWGFEILSGGPPIVHSQLSFPTLELVDILQFRSVKAYENSTFLTDLYLKRGWSLRRISEELDCSKGTVRKKLIEAGIEVTQHRQDENKTLLKKILQMRSRGLSFQAIADTFNLWKVATRSGEGKWYAKTVRDILN